MSLTSDIAGDWQYIEGIQEVTLTPKNRTVAATASVKALQRQLTKADLQLIGEASALDSQWVVWHVWNKRDGLANVNATAGADPRQSDWLTAADGTVWIVKNVTWSPRTGRWRLLCEQAR